MTREPDHLPPLGALRAFEAAARLGNFTHAGRELGLSQAAVSQHVRTLERDLGVALFLRRHRSVEPTAAGRRLFASVRVALETIGGVAREIRASRSPSQFRVAADLSFAHYWLLPHIGDFAGGACGLAPGILASDDENECLREDIDAAVLFGTGQWPGRESGLLAAEEVFPVCSPAYLQAHGPLDLSRLDGHVLLDLDGRWDWMRWSRWLCEQRLPAAHGATLREFNSWPLLTEAAVASQGLGLGWRHLSDRLLASGALVRPVAGSVRTSRGYYVVTRPGPSGAAQRFRDWLLGSVAAGS